MRADLVTWLSAPPIAPTSLLAHRSLSQTLRNPSSSAARACASAGRGSSTRPGSRYAPSRYGLASVTSSGAAWIVRLLRLSGHEHEIVLDRTPIAGNTRRRPRIRLGVAHESPQERALDGEHSIGVEIVARRVEDVGGERAVPRRAHDHVDVRRPPRMAARAGQHPSDGAVVGDRVGHGPDGDEG